MSYLDTSELRRLKDKASPAHLSCKDRIRSWLLARKHGVSTGSGVVFKPGVELSVCDGGALELGAGCFIHNDVWFLLTMPHPKVTLGEHVYVGRETIVASKQQVSIGSYTIIAPRCYIVDHEHGFEADQLILNQQSTLKTVTIGRDCYLGTGAIVTGGTTIGDGAIVGAGSVVTKDIPANEIWAGNPARFIRNRT